MQKIFSLALLFVCATSFAEKCTLGVSKAFPNLPALASPLDMIQPESDPSFWYVALRDGKIVSFENNAETNQVHVALDISDKVNNQVEMGLTGIALHPEFPKDNRIFVTYNDSSIGNQSTLASFKVDIETRTIERASEKKIITVPQDALFHNGGNVIFGPDKMLYTAYGDGGYTLNYSQDKDNLYGALLRIDINQDPYSAPKDNPFNDGQALCQNGSGKKTCPEIYAYGFRNPWRFSFDTKDKKLWLADVGEESFEEINLVVPGKNYGWPKTEGTECFDAMFCFSWGLIDPHNGYDLEAGQSIVGGYVYRGKNIPSLQGKYIFGDTFSFDFFAIPHDAEPNTEFEPLFNSGFMVASLAEGADKEVYLLNFAGTKVGEGIYKIGETCK